MLKELKEKNVRQEGNNFILVSGGFVEFNVIIFRFLKGIDI